MKDFYEKDLLINNGQMKYPQIIKIINTKSIF